MNADRHEALVALGCLCCLENLTHPGRGLCAVPLGGAIYVECHHLNAGGLHGGKRLGDQHTVPLCSWHHRAVPCEGVRRSAMTAAYGPSWAGGSKPFRAVYGYDADLLDRANRLIERRQAA